jgi:hypothetical protein
VGATLRDVALDACVDAASSFVSDLPTLIEGALPTKSWKLEYVLGRLE